LISKPNKRARGERKGLINDREGKPLRDERKALTGEERKEGVDEWKGKRGVDERVDSAERGRKRRLRQQVAKVQ